MKYIKSYILLISVILIWGCESWDDLQVNPNAPSQATPSTIFTGILVDLDPVAWDYTMRHNQFFCINESYYGNQNFLWTRTSLKYDVIRNIEKMEEETLRLSGPTLNPYLGLAKFLKAYFLIDMTRRVGDIPLSEALKADEGIFTPKYDSQKQVYLEALNLLEKANDEITEILIDNPSATVNGDIYLNGSVQSWQKTINSYTLRVLISLSHKESDPDLKISERFSAIVNSPEKYPLISSNDESLKATWVDNNLNTYPLFRPGSGAGNSQQRFPISMTYLDILTELKDPRTFVVASPTPESANSGNPDYATDFSSYRGANPGALQADIYIQSVEGQLSSFNPDHFYSPTGEQTFLLSWAETEFSIAEAINRGWIPGDASQHYQRGIRASMLHYGIPESKIQDFLNSEKVAYTGDNQEGLTQILLQKYVAFFQNSGWEAFYNQRRTGVPSFKVGPANENGNKIPKRWMYPLNEFQVNEQNVSDAINRQYNGSDDINAEMWLIK
ncbi:SusD/RagB family nutrient-binding outer membrane lipoprotein [Echinicola sediminis]